MSVCWGGKSQLWTGRELRDWNRALKMITTQQERTDQDLLKAIYEFLFDTPNHTLCDGDRAAVVLLVALHRGTDVTRLASLTAYPIGFVQQIADRMQRSGIWKGETVEYDWDVGETSLFAFTMDTLVAAGCLIRLNKKRKGRYIYQAARYARGQVSIN